MDSKNKQLSEDDVVNVSGGKKTSEMSEEAKEYIRAVRQLSKKFTPNKNEVKARKRSILETYDLMNNDIDSDEEDDDLEDDF